MRSSSSNSRGSSSSSMIRAATTDSARARTIRLLPDPPLSCPTNSTRRIVMVPSRPACRRDPSVDPAESVRPSGVSRSPRQVRPAARRRTPVGPADLPFDIGCLRIAGATAARSSRDARRAFACSRLASCRRTESINPVSLRAVMGLPSRCLTPCWASAAAMATQVAPSTLRRSISVRFARTTAIAPLAFDLKPPATDLARLSATRRPG